MMFYKDKVECRASLVDLEKALCSSDFKRADELLTLAVCSGNVYMLVGIPRSCHRVRHMLDSYDDKSMLALAKLKTYYEVQNEESKRESIA